MSSDCSPLLSLPPEILSLSLSYLSPVSVCQLEKSSKQAGAAVINTTFWKKCVERFSRRNEFVSSLCLKVQDKGYKGGEIFKLIVRADWILKKTLRNLWRFAHAMRDEITQYELKMENEHDFDDGFVYEEFGSDDKYCEGCSNTAFQKSWEVEIFPEEKKIEFVEVVKEFMFEGEKVIKEGFIHSKKGPEPTMRKKCFKVYNLETSRKSCFKVNNRPSETEIKIWCFVDEGSYPRGFGYMDDHIYWYGDTRHLYESDSEYSDEVEEDSDDSR